MDPHIRIVCDACNVYYGYMMFCCCFSRWFLEWMDSRWNEDNNRLSYLSYGTMLSLDSHWIAVFEDECSIVPIDLVQKSIDHVWWLDCENNRIQHRKDKAVTLVLHMMRYD